MLDDRTLFGDFLAPTDNALAEAEVSPSLARAAGYHRPPPPALFLAEGVDELAASPALDRMFRSYAWVAPLRAGEPRLWQIDDLAAGIVTARSELQSASFAFDLLAPVEELREAQATSRAAGRRLGVVGGEAAALLFAFALLAAMTLRPDLLAARRRLAWYGARGWQLALVTVAESAALAVVGTAIGLAVGLLGAAVVAERAGAPVADVLLRSILSGGGLALAVARRGRGDRRPRRRRRGARVADAVRASRRCRRGRGSARRSRGHARRRRGRSAVAAPGAGHVRRGRPHRPAAAAGAPARRAARARPLARPADRLAVARAQPRLRDRGHGLPRRQLRSGSLRRELPLDARSRRARPGGAPGSARLRRQGGPAAPDPGAGRRAARTLRRAARRRGDAGAAAHRRRRAARGRDRDHAPRDRSRRARASERLARQRGARVAAGAGFADRGAAGDKRPPARPHAAGAHRGRRPGPPLRRDRGSDGPLLARRPRRAAAAGGARRVGSQGSRSSRTPGSRSGAPTRGKQCSGR